VLKHLERDERAHPQTQWIRTCALVTSVAFIRAITTAPRPFIGRVRRSCFVERTCTPKVWRSIRAFG
jgi:hypothetical protein